MSDDRVQRVSIRPRSDDEPVALEVSLEDVRAADDIRISYDFERDGWVIQQASNTGPWPADAALDEGWQEVAFVKAWALSGPPA